MKLFRIWAIKQQKIIQHQRKPFLLQISIQILRRMSIFQGQKETNDTTFLKILVKSQEEKVLGSLLGIRNINHFRFVLIHRQSGGLLKMYWPQKYLQSSSPRILTTSNIRGHLFLLNYYQNLICKKSENFRERIIDFLNTIVCSQGSKLCPSYCSLYYNILPPIKHIFFS